MRYYLVKIKPEPVCCRKEVWTVRAASKKGARRQAQMASNGITMEIMPIRDFATKQFEF